MKGAAMKNKNWFWGIFFLLSAIFVIGSQTGFFGRIGVLTLVATILLAALIVSSIIDRNFFGVFISLAFLYLIYQQPLHLIAISVWLLFVAAILASIGFSCIFNVHGFDHRNWHGKDGTGIQSTENIDDNNPSARLSFGSTCKYLHATSLQTGHFSTSFGEMSLYFDQTQLSPQGAEIYLECSFGSIKLYLPRNWRVKNNIQVSLADVKEDIRRNQPDENAPLVSLIGNVSFGDIEIYYI